MVDTAITNNSISPKQMFEWLYHKIVKTETTFDDAWVNYNGIILNPPTLQL